jgi:hypothetical protein
MDARAPRIMNRRERAAEAAALVHPPAREAAVSVKHRFAAASGSRPAAPLSRGESAF